jgi:hypothetical protein
MVKNVITHEERIERQEMINVIILEEFLQQIVE